MFQISPAETLALSLSDLELWMAQAIRIRKEAE